MPSNDPINISRSGSGGGNEGRLNCSDKEGNGGRGLRREQGRKGKGSKRLVNCHDAQSLMEEGEVRDGTFT